MTRAAQLRSYQVDPDHLDDFLTTWRDRVVPMRERHGLHTLEAWLDRHDAQFVWISYVDEGRDHAEVEARYLASDERRALTPDPAGWLLETDVRMVQSVHWEAPR